MMKMHTFLELIVLSLFVVANSVCETMVPIPACSSDPGTPICDHPSEVGGQAAPGPTSGPDDPRLGVNQFLGLNQIVSNFGVAQRINGPSIIAQPVPAGQFDALATAGFPVPTEIITANFNAIYFKKGSCQLTLLQNDACSFYWKAPALGGTTTQVDVGGSDAGDVLGTFSGSPVPVSYRKNVRVFQSVGASTCKYLHTCKILQRIGSSGGGMCIGGTFDDGTPKTVCSCPPVIAGQP